MRSISKLFIILFLLFLPACNKNNDKIIVNPEPAATEITGKVKDSLTKKGIEGVLISTTPSTKTVLSNSNGQFIISNIESGIYIVHFSKKGYHSDSVKVDVKKNQNVTIESELLEINYLQDITLSTDSLNYYFNGKLLPIPIIIKNYTDTTVYYGKCGSTPFFAVDNYNNGNWLKGRFWGNPCWAIFTFKTVGVQPYSSSIDTLYITNTGIFRFRLLFGFDNGNLISDTLVSNRFEVE